MMRAFFAAFVLAAIAATALAHPGSGIVVDRRGNVYFLDTATGVWMVGTDGKLTHRGGPRFHWMAIDEGERPAGSAVPSLPGGEIAAVGSNPTVFVSSDVPIAIGSDGTFYYPQFARDDERLRIMQLTRSGERSVRATLPKREGTALRWINGLAAGQDGSLYYTEDKAIRKIDPKGEITTVAENVAVKDCSAIPGNEPAVGPLLRGLAVAADGTIHVAAAGCGAVLRISRGGEITTVLRTISPWSPTAVALSPTGVYVEEYLHTVVEDRLLWLPRVRKILPDGSITDVAAVERPKAH